MNGTLATHQPDKKIMISPQDVAQAYRLILGREPENEEVLNRYAREIKDLDALRDLFISSSEFRREFERRHTVRRYRRGFHGPEMIVELDATEEQLRALSAKTAEQWKHLGEVEPYWSVITQDHYLMDRIEAHIADFYQSGQAEVQYLDATLKRHNIELSGEGRCLELGCGVGRVTGALAKRFREVVAVDISEPHLKLARENLQNQGVSNVQYEHLTALDQTQEYGPVDFFYSKIVLQHNPPPVMAAILEKMLESLILGGVGHFQVPVFKAGYSFLIEPYLRQGNATNMEMHFMPQASLFAIIEKSNCKILELYEDESIGSSPSMLSNTVLVEKRG